VIFGWNALSASTLAWLVSRVVCLRGRQEPRYRLAGRNVLFLPRLPVGP
jgi:hypothetical protein